MALAHAVATAAGFKISHCDVDDESVDITLCATGASGTYRNPRLDIQLKCTVSDFMHADGMHYPLKKKNYDDLRATNLIVPKILVVLRVPSDSSIDWLECNSGTDYKLFKYAWWVSLRGDADKPGIEKPTVILPIAQEFNVDNLVAIMERISNGNTP